MNKTVFFSSILFAGACAQLGGSHQLTKDDVRNMGKADDGHDYCQEYGWYGDGVCDAFCPQRDPDCATDARAPELKNPTDFLPSKISLEAGIAQAAMTGPVIEAKFEPDDSGNLSLSIYPVKDAALDSERNIFQELSGDPTATPWMPGLDTFSDFQHLTRSSRDLTLVQLSSRSIAHAVHEIGEDGGNVYWAIPTIQEGRAGYGVWALYGDEHEARYQFVDGAGGYGGDDLADLGAGPGAGATDARVPELGGDPSIVRTATIDLRAGIQQVLQTYPAVVEAKYEIGDDGKLSLSIYPVQQATSVDAERQTFFEVAGHPTDATFAPDTAKFDVPDFEHVTRSARDLTLVQTMRVTILDAIDRAASEVPGGIVYWAIPTIRGTAAGFGVYVLAPDNTSHYFFVS
jgi:hypothetical protein